jgi:hypothetical protein
VSTYSELENVLFAWYHQARTSGIPVDGKILQEKSLKIAATMSFKLLDLPLQSTPRPGI